jgi:hypothetical protein
MSTTKLGESALRTALAALLEALDDLADPAVGRAWAVATASALIPTIATNAVQARIQVPRTLFPVESLLAIRMTSMGQIPTSSTFLVHQGSRRENGVAEIRDAVDFSKVSESLRRSDYWQARHSS